MCMRRCPPSAPASSAGDAQPAPAGAGPSRPVHNRKVFRKRQGSGPRYWLLLKFEFNLDRFVVLTRDAYVNSKFVEKHEFQITHLLACLPAATLHDQTHLRNRKLTIQVHLLIHDKCYL